MTRIPRTKAEFDRMQPIDQSDVKRALVKSRFSAMCDAVNPQWLQEFSPVLHESDMEELELKRQRHAKSRVIQDLLFGIQRSLRRNPTWWQILEEILRREGFFELYQVMNPWEDRHGEGAAGGDDGRGGRGGGGGGGGGGGDKGLGGTGHGATPRTTARGTPSYPPPLPAPACCQTTPYTPSTPLSHTAGIHQLLAPLCKEDNDVLWRDLAEGLGLTYGDQIQIVKECRNGDIARKLLYHYISRYQEAATVDNLVRALQTLGVEGLRVVREMERRKLIQPLERAGSEADGEVGGTVYDDDREGGTSATASQAPTPRLPPAASHTQANLFLPGSVTGGEKPTRDANLSEHLPKKEGCERKDLPCLDKLVPRNNEAVSRHELLGLPTAVSTETDMQGDRYGNSSSTDSIVDNASQLNIASPLDPAPVPEKKESNLRHADTANEDTDVARSREEVHQDCPPGTDSPPSSPHQSPRAEAPLPPFSDLLQPPQEEAVDQQRALVPGAPQQEEAVDQQGASAPQTAQRPEPHFPAQPSTTPTIIFNINKVSEICLANDVRTGGDERPRYDRFTLGSNDSSFSPGQTETGSYSQTSPTEEGTGPWSENHEGGSGESTLDSYRPHPTDRTAHETHPKLRLHQEEEQHLSESEHVSEEEEDVSDINLRTTYGVRHDDSAVSLLGCPEDPQGRWLRSTGSPLGNGTAAFSCEDTEEPDMHHSAGNHPPAPTPAPAPAPPPQHDNQVGEQFPSPPPPAPAPRGGVVTCFFNAIKDAYLGLE